MQFLPREVSDGLDAARTMALKKRSRLCVHVGTEIYPILRLWQDGFALEAARAPGLPGLVDIFDGSRHLYQCLIMVSVEEHGELICEFKRNTMAVDQAPLDFYREEDRPVALLPRRF